MIDERMRSFGFCLKSRMRWVSLLGIDAFLLFGDLNGYSAFVIVS